MSDSGRFVCCCGERCRRKAAVRELRTLEYVIAVADLGHFSKAAEHCHVSQSTLSLQIRSLENQLEVELLERSAHPSLPTPIGQQLIALMRVATHSIQELQGLAKSLHPVTVAEHGIAG